MTVLLPASATPLPQDVEAQNGCHLTKATLSGAEFSTSEGFGRGWYFRGNHGWFRCENQGVQVLTATKHTEMALFPSTKRPWCTGFDLLLNLHGFSIAIKMSGSNLSRGSTNTTDEFRYHWNILEREDFTFGMYIDPYQPPRQGECSHNSFPGLSLCWVRNSQVKRLIY